MMKTMIDIFSAIAIVLLLANTSRAMSEEHPACSKEDNEYSLEMAGVDGDKAVQFGLTIQSAVRDRNIARIFAMVDGELQNGPRRAFIKGKSFNQIFSEEWRSIILAQKPSCGPVGWRGFMLGNGKLWYQFTNDGTGKIFVINGVQEEVPSSEIMMHAGSAIKPWCFTRIWRSGDNYEYFYEKYVDSDRDNLYSDAYNMFTRYIGKYFGSEVPLGSIASPWSGYGNSDTIALASEISECQQELSQEALEEFRPNSSYSVLKDVSNKYCKQLAPHIEGNCLDLALVTVTGPLGYSKTDVDTALYAVFEDEDADVYIVPLVNFDSANDGLNFVDSLSLDAGLAGGVSAASASDLPDCVGDDYTSWNNCVGTHTYANARGEPYTKYVGEYKDGKKNGQGTYTFSDWKYVGWFKNDAYNGQGTLTRADGRKFVGEFRYDEESKRVSRHGIATWENGDQYVGELTGFKRNGQGTFTSADDEKYVGAFKDDKYNGQGTMTAANGDKYVGEWKHSEKNGQGTYTWSNGDKHVGEFKDGKPNGQGTLTYADGGEYVGEFKNNKMNGQGTYTYANGDKYVGEFKDEKFNGQGTYTSKDRTIREGIWEDDEFLGTVAEVERAERARIAAEEKAERIYNACLLDKSPSVDMSVTSVEKAVKATCRSIAKAPSFLEGLRYD